MQLVPEKHETSAKRGKHATGAGKTSNRCQARENKRNLGTSWFWDITKRGKHATGTGKTSNQCQARENKRNSGNSWFWDITLVSKWSLWSSGKKTLSIHSYRLFSMTARMVVSIHMETILSLFQPQAWHTNSLYKLPFISVNIICENSMPHQLNSVLPLYHCRNSRMYTEQKGPLADRSTALCIPTQFLKYSQYGAGCRSVEIKGISGIG